MVEWSGNNLGASFVSNHMAISMGNTESNILEPKRGESSYNKWRFHIDPSRLYRFRGRDEILAEIYKAFLSCKEEVELSKVFVLYGASGRGKTAICEKFSSKYVNDYWAIWKIDASSEANIESGFLNIGDSEPSLNSSTSEDTTLRVKSIISNLMSFKKFWLLVFDDAVDQVKLEQYIPNSSYGSILVTTHNPALLEHIQLQGHQKVDTLPKDIATSLLLGLAQSSSEKISEISQSGRDVIEYLVDKLSCLPAAIVLAGNTIYKEGHHTRTLESRLEKYKIALEQQPFSNHKLLDIWAPYDVLMKRLYMENPDIAEDAKHLLYFFAFMSRNGISSEMLELALKGNEMSSDNSSSIRTQPNRFPFRLLKDRGLSHDQEIERLENAVNMLASNSLIDVKKKPGGSYEIWLQELIQDCARVYRHGETADDEDAALNALYTISQSITWKYNAANRSLIRSLLPHIESIRLVYDMEKSEALGSFTLREEAGMILRIARVYFECSKFDAASKLQKYILGKIESTLEYNDDLVLQAKSKLATSYHCLDGLSQKWDALMLRQDVRIARARQFRTSPSPATTDLYLVALSSLADSFEHLTQPWEAVHLREKILKMRTEETDPLATMGAKRRLARTYFLLGDRIKAFTFRKQIENDLNSFKLDQDHFGLDVKSDLAESYFDLGLLDLAISLQEDVISGRTRLLGERINGKFYSDHYDVLAAKSNLAFCYTYSAERHNTALELRQEILASYTKAFGFNHPTTLRSKRELASILHKIGNFEKAAELCSDVFKGWEKFATWNQGLPSIQHLREKAKVIARLANLEDYFPKYLEKCSKPSEFLLAQTSKLYTILEDNNLLSSNFVTTGYGNTYTKDWITTNAGIFRQKDFQGVKLELQDLGIIEKNTRNGDQEVLNIISKLKTMKEVQDNENTTSEKVHRDMIPPPVRRQQTIATQLRKALAYTASLYTAPDSLDASIQQRKAVKTRLRNWFARVLNKRKSQKKDPILTLELEASIGQILDDFQITTFPLTWTLDCGYLANDVAKCYTALACFEEAKDIRENLVAQLEPFKHIPGLDRLYLTVSKALVKDYNKLRLEIAGSIIDRAEPESPKIPTKHHSKDQISESPSPKELTKAPNQGSNFIDSSNGSFTTPITSDTEFDISEAFLSPAAPSGTLAENSEILSNTPTPATGKRDSQDHPVIQPTKEKYKSLKSGTLVDLRIQLTSKEIHLWEEIAEIYKFNLAEWDEVEDLLGNFPSIFKEQRAFLEKKLHMMNRRARNVKRMKVVEEEGEETIRNQDTLSKHSSCNDSFSERWPRPKRLNLFNKHIKICPSKACKGSYGPRHRRCPDCPKSRNAIKYSAKKRRKVRHKYDCCKCGHFLIEFQPKYHKFISSSSSDDIWDDIYKRVMRRHSDDDVPIGRGIGGISDHETGHKKILLPNAP